MYRTFFSRPPRGKTAPLPPCKKRSFVKSFSHLPRPLPPKTKRKRFPFCLRGTIITSRLSPSPER
ncbi:hypothetical protein HMPREF0262_02384 [Clostridium sp. ATCC 29733]|nr:hypothetical protein HMPREF0262_02384 [Clostridium sp. ATCC 29733]